MCVRVGLCTSVHSCVSVYVFYHTAAMVCLHMLAVCVCVCVCVCVWRNIGGGGREACVSDRVHV